MEVWYLIVLAVVCMLVAVAEPSAAERAKAAAMLKASTVSLADTYGGSEERVPSVFVMGAQKGGSSSLYEVLIRHPALCGAIYKEPNFFLTNKRDGRDIKWYLSLFIDQKCYKRPKKMYVDGSCMLHGLDVALATLNATYHPDQLRSLKFIALLREPVSRDYSWFKHRARGHLNRGGTFASLKTYGECFFFRGRDNSNNESTTAAAAAAAASASFDPLRVPHCHTRGDYLTQLETFTRFFRRDQVLVLNSKLLFSDSPSLMPAVAQFLGMKMSTMWQPPFPRLDHIDQHIKSPACVQRVVPELDCTTRDRLAAFYKGRNLALETWLNDTRTKGLAHPAEPLFVSFGNSHLSLPCAADARANLDQVVKKAKRPSCVDAANP